MRLGARGGGQSGGVGDCCALRTMANQLFCTRQSLLSGRRATCKTERGRWGQVTSPTRLEMAIKRRAAEQARKAAGVGMVRPPAARRPPPC